MQADVPGANDAQRLPLEIKADKRRSFHVSGAYLLVGLVHLTAQHKDERERVLCHGVLAVGRNICHRDPALLAVVEVDVVDSRRPRGDDFQRGEKRQRGSIQLGMDERRNAFRIGVALRGLGNRCLRLLEYCINSFEAVAQVGALPILGLEEDNLH